ncbi:MAG: hypothetical protein AB7R55_20070 [Gemmatimonadales bacterium]
MLERVLSLEALCSASWEFTARKEINAIAQTGTIAQATKSNSNRRPRRVR